MMTPEAYRRLMWSRIAWLAFAMAWAFLAVSLVSYHPADPPAANVAPHNNPPMNWCGLVGAILAHLAYSAMGWGAYVVMALALLALGVVGAGRAISHVAVRAIGTVLLGATAAVMQSLAFPDTGPVAALPGGVIGTVGEHFLTSKFGQVGTVIWSVLAFAVGATVALDIWAWLVAAWTGRVIVAGAKSGGRLAVRAGSAIKRRADAARTAGTDDTVRPDDVSDDSDLTALRTNAPAGAGKKTRKAGAKAAGATETIDETLGGLGATESFDPDNAGASTKKSRKKAPTAPAAPEMDADDTDEDDTDLDDGDTEPTPGPTPSAGEAVATAATGTTPAAAAPAAAATPASFDPDTLRAKIAKLPVRFAATTTRSATEEDLRDIQNAGEQNLEGYRFPGLDQLEEPEHNFSQTMEKFVREQAEALERALREYKIEGEVVGVESGPVITLYELRLAPGTKVAALNAISSDLARSMKAINIRIVSNMAGRDTVGVEVPNAQKEKVRLKELMTKGDVYASMRLPMFLGKDASGEPLICDLASMPHLLIAGTTGSGKSVCMNSILMSFLYTKKPNELKLVLVDPKMVELSQFKDIPHLMCPVVTEMGKATAILEWAVNKMDERYELLAEAGCRDISGYNELEWDELKERLGVTTPEQEAQVPRKLPYMVFVIDELADLMMTNKEVEHSIVRIAQKARAVGMHLILATQRPQANVVTGLIKSNMPARIAFKVASSMDSRIVLDQKGGELLLGQGDMLYLSPRSSKLTRAQGTLVDDREIRRVVKFMRDVAEPNFERQLLQIRSVNAAGGEEDAHDPAEIDRNGLLAAQEDPLFDKAVEIVLETKRGSVSMLQRHLAIGYTRAARLIEMMGEAGILGQHKGTVAREVAMTIEEWRAIKAQAEADAKAAEEAEKRNHLAPKPVAATLEQAQSIVNDGNLREQLESAPKATDEFDDDLEAAEEIDEDELDDADEDIGGEEEDDVGETEDADHETKSSASKPPFDVVLRINSNSNKSPRKG
ncbi:MAG: DNA translocase FtsK [Planctomycetota bacterium]|nr:DNA translocase FtsK [Planctomycetota bacterium]